MVKAVRGGERRVAVDIQTALTARRRNDVDVFWPDMVVGQNRRRGRDRVSCGVVTVKHCSAADRVNELAFFKD